MLIFDNVILLFYNFVGDFMNTIKNNMQSIKIIKKSKFITKIFFIQNVDEALKFINDTKTEYSDATHVCYGYICDNNIKFSDDNEPSNTAGMPIYNVLKNNNLNHVLAIVIRYFGGIKLGAGGLVRAYSNCVSEIIQNNLTKIIPGYLIEIAFDYNNIKEIEYILKDYEIIYKNYDINIVFNFKCSSNDFDTLRYKLNDYVDEIEIKKDIIMKR